MINYEIPKEWIKYDGQRLANTFAEAKASVLSLKTVPYQRRWVDELQTIELKREVAGTSRIEGAEFTEQELEAAMKETPEQLLTRSQKQAHAVVKTYRWIAQLEPDIPLNAELICAIHRNIVTGADDDHCPPGRLRKQNENVNFGAPRHRGAEGGDECKEAYHQLTEALQKEYRGHDPMIQALAVHYHIAAMHPFLDGNGRTARAVEALMLQRAGLRDTCFIAMSNYYYDEKNAYLTTLAEVRQSGHDLTPFLLFALKGIAIQSQRLLKQIQLQISKELFRNIMYELFNRLKSPRKRLIAERQMEILKILLEVEHMEYEVLRRATKGIYGKLKNPDSALIRDLLNLGNLNAISIKKIGENRWTLVVRLEWPTEITETDFFAKLKYFPKAKSLSFLR